MTFAKAVYGLFPNPDSAERAFHRLSEERDKLSVRESDIFARSSEPFDQYDFGRRDHKTAMPWFAALGGLIGGLSGFWFVSFTQKSYPLVSGGMNVVTKWTDGIITYELIMLGAILATLVMLLVSARLPNWKTGIYDPEISSGKIMIGVQNPEESSRTQLVKTLLEAGAEQVKEFPAP